MEEKAKKLKQAKPKKCRCGCGATFFPRSSTQIAATWQCALKITEKARERKEQSDAKEQRRVTRAAKEKMKTRREWMSDAQDAFNAFIRFRDRDDPCICCGQFAPDEDWIPGGRWDAGHFLSRGAYPELRFEEDNCHKQLKSCNAGSSKYARKGRTVSESYRKRLIEKIGIERVEWLEGPHEPKHYSIDDLKRIRDEYRAKLKELKAHEKNLP